MSIADLARSGFVAAATAGLLAGCSGTPVSPAVGQPSFAVTRTGVTVMHRANHRSSHLIKPAAGQALLYVSDAGTSSVEIFNYPQGTAAGTITGFSYPQGDCSDDQGNVYVVDSGSSQIFEYAYGGTTPIATFSDPNEFPVSCAFDPNSGSLAVSNILSPTQFEIGSISVYAPGSSTPAIYTDPKFAREYFLAYDGSSNLYVDGVDSATSGFRFAKMSPAGKFTEIKLKGAKITFPGGVQVVGSYVAVGDQDGPVFGTPDVYRVSPAGKVLGKTTLSTANGRFGDPVQFIMVSNNKKVVAADAIGESVYTNSWTKGRYVSTINAGLVTPIGIALSLPPSK